MLGGRICCAGNVTAQCCLASWELGDRTGRNGQVSELCHLDRAGMGGRVPPTARAPRLLSSWDDAARRAELFSS